MSEFVLGTGHKQTLRNVLRLVEGNIVKRDGVPRRIRLSTDTVTIEAKRPDFKGDFEHYTITLPHEMVEAEAIRAFAATYPDLVTLEETDYTWHVTCPSEGTPYSAKVLEVINKFSTLVNLPEVWHAEGHDYRIEQISVEMLFHAMVQYRASDIHLSPGLSPVFRIDNDTRFSEIMAPLSSVQISDLVRRISPLGCYEEFQNYKQASFSYHQAGIGFARVSAFLKNGAPHCTFRYLPEKIPSFDDLHIPPAQLNVIANLPRGLILITGMTGSGKTTTVSALVDWINTNKSLHILTIENPVEYVHANKKSIISQRSLGQDVDSFGDAVTGALRHDPDVILIGEMRDPDTIRSAINAAATGHLVISTMHSNTASEVVNRIVSFFDPVERDLVRLQIRDCLKVVICQRLVPKVGGGRVPALEFLFNDIKPINDGVMKGDTDLIRIGMQQSVSHSMLFEQYLLKMLKDEVIDEEHAREAATDVSILDQMRMGTYSIPRLESLKSG